MTRVIVNRYQGYQPIVDSGEEWKRFGCYVRLHAAQSLELLDCLNGERSGYTIISN